MNQEVINNIRQNSKAELDALSDQDMQLLLDTTIKAIDSIIEKGDSIEINDFGTFLRRKNGNKSVSVFKPTDRLSDRISRKR